MLDRWFMFRLLREPGHLPRHPMDHVYPLPNPLERHVLVVNANFAKTMAKLAVCFVVTFCVIRLRVNLSARSWGPMSVRFAVGLEMMRILETTAPDWKRRRKWSMPSQFVWRKPNVKATDNCANKIRFLTFEKSTYCTYFDLLVSLKMLLPFFYVPCTMNITLELWSAIFSFCFNLVFHKSLI